MAKCDYCGSSIIFGGRHEGDLRFCNEHCLERGVLLSVADQIPEDMLAEHVKKVHQGACPKCGGDGPIDVQTSHRVWSALIMTSWRSRPQICCGSCGFKAKLGDAFYSLVLGWWGFPWGFIMTPVQLVRNLAGLMSGPHPYEPSPQLRKLVALNLAAHVVQSSQAEQTTA